MPSRLRDLTRDFAMGEAPLEAMRTAARTERIDRRFADELLQVIADWERSPWVNSPWYRNELRARVKALTPPEPPEPPPKKKDYTAIMYNAGLRGQQR